jgi:hypothetical protein
MSQIQIKHVTNTFFHAEQEEVKIVFLTKKYGLQISVAERAANNCLIIFLARAEAGKA